MQEQEKEKKVEEITAALNQKVVDITETLKWYNRVSISKLTLPQNLAKGTWRTMSINQLFKLLLAEVNELNAEIIDMQILNDQNHENDVMLKIIQECVDVSNFAMFIADVARFRVALNQSEIAGEEGKAQQ